MTSKNLIYRASYYTYAIQGMVAVSLGLLLPHMIKAYSINYSQGGALIFCMLIGGVISSAFGGALVGKLSEKRLTNIGSICLILGYGLMIFINNVSIIYFLLFVIGFGIGFYNIALNTLIANVSSADPKKISTLHIFFAVGALIATVVSALITYFHMPWKIFFCLLVAMSMLSILLMSIAHINQTHTKNKIKKSNLSFIRLPHMYIFVALLFFYVGTECAINGWVITFLNESDIVSDTASNYVLTVLWALVIVGRKINSKLSSSIALENRILACAIVILTSYIFFISTQSIVGLILSVVVLGLAMSALYPNVVANSTEKIKDNPTALGVILSFGGLGGAIVPWINGIIAEGYGLKMGMIAVNGAIALLLCAAIINKILGKKQSKIN